MEMTLFQRNKETWTRFKIGINEIKTFPQHLLTPLGEPTKKSSRFVYYEVVGDLLNNKKNSSKI